MSSDELVDWAFSAQDTVQKEVQGKFPHEAHRWPLLSTFAAEGYTWSEAHLVVVLRHRVSGVPHIGELQVLDDPAAPKAAPTQDNIDSWHTFLIKQFSVEPADFVMIIPKAQGSTVKERWAKWSPADRELWRVQVKMNLMRHFYHLKGFDLVSDFFIPPGYLFLAEECQRFLQDHPNYDRNVFIMTRLVSANPLLEELDSELRTVLRDCGLSPVRADDKMYMPDRNLWNNVCVYMICCKYGIAILEDRIADEFNPNVAMEYGFMRALNKSALLLADTGFRNLRADIIGTLREEFDITDIRGTIRQPVEKWLSELKLVTS